MQGIRKDRTDFTANMLEVQIWGSCCGFLKLAKLCPIILKNINFPRNRRVNNSSIVAIVTYNLKLLYYRNVVWTTTD